MVSKKIVLHFPNKLVDQPIVYKLVKDYNLKFNILKASITPKEEGLLVLELNGEEKDYKQGVNYLKESGVKVQPLSRDVVRNEAKCTHCGVCVPICPTAALVVDPLTRKVNFYNDKCIACELCIKACPVRAMEVHF
ncbi:MAG: NIL domain-containing protein [Candidatus Omnitrophica bacterium]|nr:NIL domain-containing protein [Candidatus Omnitrophota bacterium]MDD5352968.1 NIL domain-containing protein [Candidatus Omnitrophota bacterium]MDD5550567.1 NIL domain-containing protein [Candidatus Omnitrophota bacterium]